MLTHRSMVDHTHVEEILFPIFCSDRALTYLERIIVYGIIFPEKLNIMHGTALDSTVDLVVFSTC